MKTDAQLKKDILDELDWDPEVDASKIGVSISDGAVTLTGHVATYRQKIAAKNAAKRVGGVHALVDKLDVLLGREFSTTDEGLAERVSHVLMWNISAPGKNVRAEVKDGVVTLTGAVEWQYQRENIIKNIEHIGGVKNVVNLITVRPRLSAADLQQKITDALKRHAEIEASKVKVTVDGGTVTLDGTVETIAERDHVEDAAWAAPGVSRVIDHLRVA